MLLQLSDRYGSVQSILVTFWTRTQQDLRQAYAS